MHFPSCDPFLLHQQRFQLHPRPRRCKFLQNEFTSNFEGCAKHSPIIGFTALTHKHRAQHSKNPHPTDIIVGRLNLCYLLSYIRFIAHISAQLLLIHKEKIPFLPGKCCFLWGGEESSPWESAGISSRDLEPSPA